MTTLPPEFPDRRVCVMGLGYVGLTLAATMADVGFDVLGVEIRKDVVDRLTRGDPRRGERRAWSEFLAKHPDLEFEEFFTEGMAKGFIFVGPRDRETPEP